MFTLHRKRSHLKLCSHSHFIENTHTLTSQDTLHAQRIAEELHLKQGGGKTKRRQKDISHSNFAIKDHKEHEVHKSQGTLN
jgi:hypothetical protein